MTILPMPVIFSTIIGINIGTSANSLIKRENSMDSYANIIGYTSLGILTGLTYPVSYPLFGLYVLYRGQPPSPPIVG
jgi:hypothetical protein